MPGRPRQKAIAAAGGVPRKPYQQEGEDRVVHEFDVPSGVVRATIGTYKDQWILQIRLWIEPRDKPGTLIPTRKGISVPIQYLDDLEDATAALASAVAERNAGYRRQAQRLISTCNQLGEQVEQLRTGRRPPKQVEAAVVDNQN